MSGFDPSRYLTKLSRRAKTPEGGWRTVEQDYLEVKWRLLWFRTEHPDGHIDVQVVSLTDDAAVMRATVSWPDGGSSADIGSETAGDWKDFAEKAATKAIGRALASLGYGTQFCGDHEFSSGEDDRVVDAPVKVPGKRAAMPQSAAVPAKGAPAEADVDFKHLSAIGQRIGFSTLKPICEAYHVKPGDRAALLAALPTVTAQPNGEVVIDWPTVEDDLRFAYEEAQTPADALDADATPGTPVAAWRPSPP